MHAIAADCSYEQPAEDQVAQQIGVFFCLPHKDRNCAHQVVDRRYERGEQRTDEQRESKIRFHRSLVRDRALLIARAAAVKQSSMIAQLLGSKGKYFWMKRKVFWMKRQDRIARPQPCRVSVHN